MKITNCEFKPDTAFAGIKIAGLNLAEGCPHVHVTYEDGSTEELFSFYTDEISFTPGEFIGLTKREAMDLYRQRDIAYLRS